MSNTGNSAGSEFSVKSLQLTLKDKLRRSGKTFALKVMSKSGLADLVGRTYGGNGVILMFHEFTRDPKSKLGQGTRIDDFEAVLKMLRQSGRDIVGLSEAVRRLEDPKSRPFVVLSYDDGYRSNIELALPVMERYEAPAIIYVPTEVLTRTINAWWLGLREIVTRNDQVVVEPMNSRFECSEYSAKVATLRRLIAWVWEDFGRADGLQQVFKDNGLSMADLIEELFVSEAEMVEADRHPLVEIGAHTTTHRALRLLSAPEVSKDIGDNKTYLEGALGRNVPHFAYPYGRPSLTETREAAIVRSLGFETAVTTDPGCLFPQHAGNRFLLPRQDAEFPTDGFSHAVCGVNGVYRALASRGKSPIANTEFEQLASQ
ncbi:MAG: polysaccharide deacetylase family protein [Roseibium sp.]|uniref:polysaccharide deacetylase family protein n=1 Tax=Roseibium sp. TaxID=1936156 RepID=UPI0026238199|nr:polysaccharide deacetylase family protein [Roseibium sp.]MCV0426939.1 polysaccharide deacetylase family protein [Roseibium sp.]